MKVKIGEVGLGERNEVEKFYRTVGYTVPIVAADRVIVASYDNFVIGVVRLCYEEGYLVLRGMQIAPSAQRKGVGSRLLKYLDTLIGEKESWCLPYSHLEAFYAQIGFKRVRLDEAPEFLRQRLEGYLGHGMDNIIMRRSARAHAII